MKHHLPHYCTIKEPYASDAAFIHDIAGLCWIMTAVRSYRDQHPFLPSNGVAACMRLVIPESQPLATPAFASSFVTGPVSLGLDEYGYLPKEGETIWIVSTGGIGFCLCEYSRYCTRNWQSYLLKFHVQCIFVLVCM